MRPIIVLCLVILLPWGCNLVESPLSDVPLTSPTGLQLVAVVDRTINPNGGIASTIKANLYDKHGEYVKILDGGMRVNGLAMRDGSYGDYIDDVTPVLPAMRYRFDVVYSDGSVDSAVVRTPANLTTLTVPPSTDRIHSFTVSWGTTDANLQANVEFLGDTATARFVAPRGAGSLQVTPAMVSIIHPGQRVLVRVSYVSNGAIYAGFMSTSVVRSTFSVSRWMNF